MPGKKIWVGKPSQRPYQRLYIGCAVFFWLIVPVVYAWVHSKRLKQTHYKITDYAVMIEREYNSSSNRLIELQRITSITIEQPDKLKQYGLSNLVFKSDKEILPPVVFEAIPNAEELRGTVEGLIEDYKKKQTIKDIHIPIMQT